MMSSDGNNTCRARPFLAATLHFQWQPTPKHAWPSLLRPTSRGCDLWPRSGQWPRCVVSRRSCRDDSVHALTWLQTLLRSIRNGATWHSDPWPLRYVVVIGIVQRRRLSRRQPWSGRTTRERRRLRKILQNWNATAPSSASLLTLRCVRRLTCEFLTWVV